MTNSDVHKHLPPWHFVFFACRRSELNRNVQGCVYLEYEGEGTGTVFSATTMGKHWSVKPEKLVNIYYIKCYCRCSATFKSHQTQVFPFRCKNVKLSSNMKFPCKSKWFTSSCVTQSIWHLQSSCSSSTFDVHTIRSGMFI